MLTIQSTNIKLKHNILAVILNCSFDILQQFFRGKRKYWPSGVCNSNAVNYHLGECKLQFKCRTTHNPERKMSCNSNAVSVIKGILLKCGRLKRRSAN